MTNETPRTDALLARMGRVMCDADSLALISLAQTLEEELGEALRVLSESQKLLDECAPYLKEDETPLQRIEREHRDNSGLMTLLAEEKRRVAASTDYVEGLKARAEALQAKVDELMMEYCPEEMTPEQTAEWARHQRPSPESATVERAASPTAEVGSPAYDGPGKAGSGGRSPATINGERGAATPTGESLDGVSAAAKVPDAAPGMSLPETNRGTNDLASRPAVHEIVTAQRLRFEAENLPADSAELLGDGPAQAIYRRTAAAHGFMDAPTWVSISEDAKEYWRAEAESYWRGWGDGLRAGVGRG